MYWGKNLKNLYNKYKYDLIGRHIEYGKINKNFDNHWEKLNLKNFKITKPVVFCFGGTNTTSNREANGYCKMVENYLTLLFDNKSNLVSNNVDLIGVKYSKKRDDDEMGYMSLDECSKFVDAILLPLCFDDNNNYIEIDKICKKMSLITFFTHCYGSHIVYEIMQSFKLKLMYRRFSEDDINKILGSFVEVSYSPIITKNIIKKISFYSAKDKFVGDEIYKFLPKNFKGIKILKDNSNVSNENNINNNINIYISNLFDDYKDEHCIDYLGRDEFWNLNNEKIINCDYKNAEVVSQMIAWLLCYFVDKSFENLNEDYIERYNFNDIVVDLNSIIDGCDFEM